MALSGIRDILNELRSVSYDKRDQGTRFEVLMQAYLRSEPQYAALYSDVWLWSEYPERGNRADTGIDLVAKDRQSGELTAIQCKFYAESTQISKGDIDSFLAASSKKEFAARLIISTSDHWGRNAEEAIEGQHPPVQRLRVQDLDDSSIDWSKFELAKPSSLVKKAKKKPFPHQVKAIAAVLEGFQTNDRGKLIMACGTGKTFTALQIAEQLVRPGGTVLFLVPSISLLSQTLKEWTIESGTPLQSYAVCSDVSVGKRTDDEDIPITDLAYPASTNAKKLIEKYEENTANKENITVFFSTYQSIDVISQAQELGLPDFDLIICDEAHRTTGVTLSGDDESAFVRVHNQKYIKGFKRLYMTATPRIYNDASKSKAEEAGAVLTDMDKVEDFGPEFHRLGFGEAVSIGRLTDYKVLVLAVDETYISSKFQKLLADEDNALALEDAAKIVGCWNGLAKRSLIENDFASDPSPMKRAVAFARNIKESKQLADMFEKVVSAELDLLEDSDELLTCEVHHVDGTFNVLDRNKELDWLKEDPGVNKARILTNAKCLSEGVDVPALDAVMFLNPRDSVVDVVQSVGRVMRKLEGKQYGYVILPIAVPTDVPAEVALGDNKKYRVVWQVLQALRAHDERFDAMVNKIDLTKDTENKLSIIGVGGSGSEKGSESGQLGFTFPNLDEYKDAILARIVDKVGERGYWETWARDIAQVARTHLTRLKAVLENCDPKLRNEFDTFLEALRNNLNPSLTEFDAIEMLSQHLITKPVFDALFEGFSFSENNPVSVVMQRMIDSLDHIRLDSETERLEKFYSSVRLRASGIKDGAAKQQIVKELYERFFRNAFSATSERLGIVYTPNEIVDFINRSVNDVLRDEFNQTLSDEDVHVLDPFTGTGTFIVRLLQSGLISREDLLRKYVQELHANEIVLLAYYVAAINIEEAFHEIVGGDYKPFEGIVLTDTFQLNELDDKDELPGLEVFPENNERVLAQKRKPITVIVGNPPYSVGQSSANDNNQNLKYPALDLRIDSTYAATSSASLTKSLYDSYIRAIRWASDRIGDRGVIGFVTNGGFIDSNSADGLRKALHQEFSTLYVLNLRGNSRLSGEVAKREGGNVFDVRVGIAISILVRNPEARENTVKYFEIEDYWDKKSKLNFLSSASVAELEWTQIKPNKNNDWINQRDEQYENFIPLATKARNRSSREVSIFKTHTSGLKTNRDAWVYNFSETRLKENVQTLIANYNSEIDRLISCESTGEEFVQNRNPREINWDGTLEADLKKKKKAIFEPKNVRIALYRPFMRQFVYLDRQLNNSVYQIPSLFPDQTIENPGFVITGAGAAMEFTALATKNIPDMSIFGAQTNSLFFPKWIFPEGIGATDSLFDVDASESRVDNVTDEAVQLFEKKLGRSVSKDQIFDYVYGLLNMPIYKEKYASDLKKSLPRVPILKQFEEIANVGRELFELHDNFENVQAWDTTSPSTRNYESKIDKITYARNGRDLDKTVIVVGAESRIEGIPEQAQGFRIGSRSALDWAVERFGTKLDKDSGLKNDINELEGPEPIGAVVENQIRKIISLSLLTVELTEKLALIPYEEISLV